MRNAASLKAQRKYNLMPRILITGASGFIGQHLIKHLEKQGYSDIRAIHGRKDLDLTQPEACQKLPDGDICIHLAGAGNPTDFDRDADMAWQSNVTGTLNLLQAIQNKGYQRFIFASTYVYGRPDYIPVDEEHSVRPPHPYPRSKYMGEQLLEEFTRRSSLSGIALRIFNVYGPGQTAHMLIPTIVHQLGGDQIQLRDAVPKRDFVHVQDVVRAFEKSIHAEIEGFQRFNIASGESISVADLVRKIQELAHDQTPINYSHKPRPNEVNDVVGNIELAKQVLHWEPQISLHQGLGDLLSCVS